MYNRYVPQPDGSFRKNPVSEKTSEYDNPHPEPQETIKEHPLPQFTPEQSLRGMLRQLFPHGLDSEDLIVILLLLLMSDDPSREKNNAILTLVIYLFL